MTDREPTDLFKTITSGIDFHDTIPQKLESFTEFKDQLLVCLDDHLRWVDIDVNDKRAYVEACRTLTEWINRDAAQLDGLDLGDEVVSTGELVYVELFRDSSLTDIVILDRGDTLRGEVKTFGVSDGPSYDVLKNPGEYRNHSKPVTSKHFSLAILLGNTTIVRGAGNIEPVPSTSRIFIPLDDVELQMKKAT